jgi:hypothetical protein
MRAADEAVKPTSDLEEGVSSVPEEPKVPKRPNKNGRFVVKAVGASGRIVRGAHVASAVNKGNPLTSAVKAKALHAPETDDTDTRAEAAAPSRRTLVPAEVDVERPRAHRLQEFSQLFGSLHLSLQSKLDALSGEAEDTSAEIEKPAA